jgi:16S rRNA (guanine527-N7)-methyltransferase
VRLEDFEPERKFDTIMSRAFSDLSKMIKWSQHLLADQGQWLAMKGRYPKEELEQINYPYEVKHYTVSGMEETERCCIIIRL